MNSNRSGTFVSVLSALIFVMLTAEADAQPFRQRGILDSSRVAARVDTLAAKLSLSDSVKAKVREIYFASSEEMRQAF
ncbi:hypothetical protein GWO43_25355, partial [candidate division KSB1 bacterium]|nr:hypothetical protein [candidate division KSB1 bacterium]NIR68885.1 hypothetical protein [candidate division KSB1 bacterium]NIS27253.1 hypothetical protein [candidate division KSB1 bacterium]NIT74138.1 hypothetical protein [candidate division KSB1 bacterium]NIU27987.1 hypothetical protein [candidate division KSB1 bacterium]